eukprot:jgi/Astpho2/5322/fgenesh1_pm.00075_%23_6_t
MAQRPRFPAWARSTDEVLQHYKVDLEGGLTSDQVTEARETFGHNELTKQPGKPMWKLVLEQFDDMLVKVLLLAALISFGLAYLDNGSHEEGIRAYIEPFVILLILVLNAIVGVWQEANAEKALEALMEMQSVTAKVVRDRKLVSELPSRELVPGDVVILHVGDKVPADVRIMRLKTATLRSEQASLTGESVAVLKRTEPTHEEDCELQSKDCMLFAGTAVANGACLGVVNDIGMDTEIGKIQTQIHEAAGEEDDTPLKKKLDDFGNKLAQVIFAICVLVWAINYSNFLHWKRQPNSVLPDWTSFQFDLRGCIYYFKIAVALAVAAIPEGLPAVITTCLALGTRKMAKRNAIVRKLPSVETLGCTTVICSDKTGTLTTNQMSCVRLVAAGSTTSDLQDMTVEGTTYDPSSGHIVGYTGLTRNLEALAEVCAVCNETRIEGAAGKFKVVGAPTEAALCVLVEKLGLATLEFDRDRKSMSVIAATTGRQQNVLLVKGAAECVLSRCSKVMLADGSLKPLDGALRQKVQAVIDDMASKALRCMTLAQKTELGDLNGYDGQQSHKAHTQLLSPENYEGIESDLTLLGLAGLMDPPRPEVSGAIAACYKAGIKVVVITGDNKLTAEAVCRSIGVFSTTEDVSSKSMTGMEFKKLPAAKQREMLMGLGSRCFSRAEPRHKQDIVRLLKEMGEIAAMTGDGVNDAPALKLADIGIAMGITGTEVAKEASDMVLADDNFSTIVAAVEEGRAIYDNMKAFIRYMISSNIGEVVSIFLTAALGLPEGLIPVQLLWVNLVTDGPPATALGFNPPDLDIMEKPPRPADESLVTVWTFFRWMVIGVYVGFATVGAFAAWYMFDNVLGLPIGQDGHTPISWHQLTHWQQCRKWDNFQPQPYSAGGRTFTFDDPCDYFTYGKAKASTLSLSVLVAIEMFNALNALSEDGSLLSMPPWCNPWLLVACGVSFGLHFLILYVPLLADVFSIVPLSVTEWCLVLLFAFPVILIDEVLKFIGRRYITHDVPHAAIVSRNSKKLQ